MADIYRVDVAQKLLDKVDYASYQLECRLRTIINLGGDDVVVLYWALQEYINRHKGGV